MFADMFAFKTILKTELLVLSSFPGMSISLEQGNKYNQDAAGVQFTTVLQYLNSPSS